MAIFMRPVFIICSILVFVIKCERIDWSTRRPKICADDVNFTSASEDGKPLDVYVQIIILDLYDISEERMQFGIQISLLLKWKDPSLDLSNLTIEYPQTIPSYVSSCLWKPDIIFFNCKDSLLIQDTVPNTVYKILPTGSVYHYCRYQMTVNCDMDFKEYPMDKQVCSIKLTFFYSRSREANLYWMSESRDNLSYPSIVLRPHVKVTQFKMETPVAETTEVQHQSGNTTELICKITFVRLIMSALLNTYVPSLLVVCLSFVSFWLDVDAVPGRITLGVTSILTLSTQIVSARNALPPINYMTALDIWLFGCLLLVFLSLVEFTLANSFERRRLKRTKPMFNDVSQTDNDKGPMENVKVGSLTTDMSTEFKLGRCCKFGNRECFEDLNIDKVSRFVFPAILILLASIYWIVFLHTAGQK